MPIEVACGCGKRVAVPEKYAGRLMKCPGCGEPVSVPGLASSDAEAIRAENVTLRRSLAAARVVVALALIATAGLALLAAPKLGRPAGPRPSLTAAGDDSPEYRLAVLQMGGYGTTDTTPSPDMVDFFRGRLRRLAAFYRTTPEKIVGVIGRRLPVLRGFGVETRPAQLVGVLSIWLDADQFPDAMRDPDLILGLYHLARVRGLDDSAAGADVARTIAEYGPGR